MNKKFFAKFISLIISFSMLFTIAGCSEETVNELASIGSEILEAVEEDVGTEGLLLETSLEETTEETTEETSKATTEETSEATTEETSEATEETTSVTTEETTLEETTEATEETTIALLDVDGAYTSKDDVALYIYQYGKLPGNFITKKDARELGWEGGSLEPFAPGMSIGGDYFGNYEGLLPEANGREYHECDIDTMGASSRGAKRIIYSNDGLIYYTSDHYESFTLLYGEE